MDRASSARILYVITDLQTGGVPLHLLRLAGHAQRHEHHVSVCCLSPPGPVSAQLADACVPTTALGARGLWDWRVLERLAAHIRAGRPDVVHALLFHANIAARLACLLSGFPARRLICEIQTVEVDRRWHLWVDRWTQRGCSVIVGNSPSVIDHLTNKAHIDQSRLQLIRGGIDPVPVARAEPLPRGQLGITNHDPILLWVGRLDPVKGLDELIEAFAQILRTRPCNLLLVGDGAYRTHLEQRIRDRGLGDRIVMPGPRSDVPSILQTADLFVFPSRTEGLPNALLEAMAAGLPCVTTDVPGCRDLVEDGATGLLVRPRDPEALAAAVAQLLSTRALALRLGAAARARVERGFRLDHCLQAYLDLYARVVASAWPTPQRQVDVGSGAAAQEHGEERP